MTRGTPRKIFGQAKTSSRRTKKRKGEQKNAKNAKAIETIADPKETFYPYPTPNARFLSYRLRIEYDTFKVSPHFDRNRVKIWSYRKGYVFRKVDLRILLKGYETPKTCAGREPGARQQQLHVVTLPLFLSSSDAVPVGGRTTSWTRRGASTSAC
jgi:hypothetical protein